jgi:hypothetical protein
MLVRTAATAALVFALAGAAEGKPTDAERFRRDIDKRNKKTYCLCTQSGSVNEVGRVVLVEDVNAWLARCSVPKFLLASSGAQFGTLSCDEFEVIGP